MVPIAKDLEALGFKIMATYNTAAFLRKAGIANVQTVLKVQEGRPNAGAWREGWPRGMERSPCRQPSPSHAAACRRARAAAPSPAPRHRGKAHPAAACPPPPLCPAEDMIKNGEIQMMVITTAGDEADVRDGKELRRTALAHKVRTHAQQRARASWPLPAAANGRRRRRCTRRCCSS